MDNKLAVDELYDKLLKQILDKEFAVGDMLPSENQLCKIYGLSRGSVRGALQRLLAQNLVATRPGKGSYVISNSLEENILSKSVGQMDLSKHEYRYVVEFRKAIEFTCIELMSKYGQQEDFDRLREALERMEASVDDIEGYVQADYDFHMAITIGSHNPLFISIMNGCQDTLVKYFNEMASISKKNLKQAGENHRRIYNALIERNPEKVKAIIEGTFEYNLSRFRDVFKGGEYEDN